MSIENAGSIYDRNSELLQAYRAGSEEAGEEFVLLNRPLVFRIAGRFRERGVDIDDLVSFGNVGLVKAMASFDFSRGCAFSTYAVPLILGEIRRFLRDDGMMKVSRDDKKLCMLLSAERDRRLAIGESVGIADLAAAVGVSAEDAASALFSAVPLRSLDESVDDGEDMPLGAVVSNGEEEREFDRLAIRMAIEKLSEDDRKLILLRYFRDFSQVETAKILGTTQVRVSRREKKILEILRADILAV